MRKDLNRKMPHRSILNPKWFLILVLFALCIVAPQASAQTMAGGSTETNSEKVSFDAVQPILRKHCVRCHNEDQPRGDLVLTSLDKVLAGSSSGFVVVAGNLAESPLYLLTAHMETPKMPPNKPSIPQRELNVIERWIMSGLIEETQGSEKTVSKESVSEKPQVPPAKGKVAEPSMKPVIDSEPIVFASLAAIPQPTAVRAMATHSSQPVVAVAGFHQVAILNSDTARFETQAIDVGDRDVSALRFSPDGKYLLIAAGLIGESGTVLVLDWEKKQWLPNVGDEPDNIQSIDCNSDASQIAIGTTTRLVKILDRNAQKELFTIRKHTDWVLSVAYSPDGFLLASGDRFGGIHVWETDSGKEFAALRGHTGGITGLIWSPDGNELTSSSLDGTVRVWNMHTLQVEKQWVANERGVLSLAMDAKRGLLTSGRDGWVRKWMPEETSPSWQAQLSDEAIAICSPIANQESLIGADAAGGIYRLISSIAGPNNEAEKVLISFPISEQKRLFAATVPDAPRRISPMPIEKSESFERVVDLKPADSLASSSDLGSSTLLSDLEESRRALSSVEQSLEQTYQTAERLEESVARLKQLIVLQEARLKQNELKQKPNRK
jgi:WD40 repeat protein